VLVLDEDDRTLLILASDGEYRGSGQPVWLTPGGGVDEGETYQEAAVRELIEEVGVTGAVLGPCVWLRRLPYEMADGVPREKHERYFVCHVSHFEVDGIAEGQLDMEAVAGFRWWSVDEIEASQERFAPRRLGALLETLLRDGAPESPLDVGV
jgi:8-oxo-dGTP pyrophosphatase MutT (NUDIX family)